MHIVLTGSTCTKQSHTAMHGSPNQPSSCVCVFSVLNATAHLPIPPGHLEDRHVAVWHSKHLARCHHKLGMPAQASGTGQRTFKVRFGYKVLADAVGVVVGTAALCQSNYQNSQQTPGRFL